MKNRPFSAALIALTLAGTAFSHPANAQDHAPHPVIEVEPVRSASEARAIMERERGNIEMPELMVGSKAPKLQIAEWVKGDKVKGFEKGHTYVVEFWATWCQPCIAVFPHISELQKEYKDDLTVIGVNIWDRKQNRETGEFTEPMPELIERVNTFVAGQGSKMGYTVAIERSGEMAQNWMRAAGRNGIPSAFIVDGEGMIAWAGHPSQMDEPLEQIVAGEWDTAAGRAAQVAELEAQYWYPHTIRLLSDEETAEEGYRLAYALLRSPVAENPGILNALAWNMLTSDRVAVRDHKAAVALASVACEKTDWKNAGIIDTLARGYYEMGNYDKAVEFQNKAVELAEGTRGEADMRQSLETYKAAAQG